MPEIGDIKPTPPTWGRRPVDKPGSEPRQPRRPPPEKPRPPGEDDEDDPRGGQIDEYA